MSTASAPGRKALPGWVYVLAAGRGTGLVKIGRTTRHATNRAAELDRAPGYRRFGPWTEVLCHPVADCVHVETAAHRMLHHCRYQARGLACRELFIADVDQACAVVDAACGSLTVVRGALPRRVGAPPPVARRRGRKPGRWLPRLLVGAALLWAVLALDGDHVLLGLVRALVLLR